MIESDDGEYLEKVLASIHAATKKKEGNMIEAAWVNFQTEEVPERAYPRWIIKSYPASISQKEIKQQGGGVVERIHTVYQGMCDIGIMLTEALAQNKTEH